MSHFIFPQAWIGPAIAAAVAAFGSIDASPVRVVYRELGQSLGSHRAPRTILIDKRPASQWPRNKAQCVIAHEYGHLAGHEHSSNPRSIMHTTLTFENCQRFLRRHGL